MVQGHYQRGGHRFPSNRGNKFQNRNRIQKNGQGDRDGDTPMRDSAVNGRSRGRGNRGQLPGRFLNNRNGTRWAGEISRAANTGAVVVHDHTGSGLHVGDASAKSTGNLDRISVRGWVTSKASTEPDRGAQSVLNFLTRKTTPNRGPESGKELIKKVCLIS